MSRLCILIVDGNKNIPNLKRDWDGQHHKIYGWKPVLLLRKKLSEDVHFWLVFVHRVLYYLGAHSWRVLGVRRSRRRHWRLALETLWICSASSHNQANYWHRSHLSAVQCFVKNYSNAWITNPNDWQNEKKEFALIKSSATLTPRLHFHLKPVICVH